MRAHLESHYLIDEIEIERLDTDGLWDTVGSYLSSLQYERAAYSPNDPSAAQPNESLGRFAYVSVGNPAIVGDRITDANAERWMIVNVSPPRSNETYVRLTLAREQIATAPIVMTFRRRTAGSTVEIVTAEVRITIDQRSPLDTSQASIFSAASAKGARITGTIIGDAALLVVQPGDWFEIETMPGRVTFVDRSNEDRVQLSYTLEQRGI